MEAAIARQLASVEVQRAAVRTQRAAASFFAVLPPVAEPALSAPARPACDAVRPSDIEPVIHRAAQREGLAPALLRAVISKESAWYPCALSPKGAQGLMQLMPATADMLGVNDPFDPEQNIDGGARFLGDLLGRYNGNLALALAAYNAGPGTVDEAGGVPRIPETVDYVGWIMRRVTPQPAPAADPP